MLKMLTHVQEEHKKTHSIIGRLRHHQAAWYMVPVPPPKLLQCNIACLKDVSLYCHKSVK